MREGGRGDVQDIDAATLAERLKEAKSVIIVPATAWPSAARSTRSASSRGSARRGVNVRFAIHPVAGRLPVT